MNISSARTDEKMGDSDASAHYGLEHIGIKVEDMAAEIQRLTGMGAQLMEGPVDVANGPIIAFIKAPGRRARRAAPAPLVRAALSGFDFA